MAKGNRPNSSGYRQIECNTQYGATGGATGGIHRDTDSGTPSDASTRKENRQEENGTTITQSYSKCHSNVPKPQGKVLPSRGNSHTSLAVSPAWPPPPGIATDGDVDRTNPDNNFQLSRAVNKENTIITEETQVPVRSDQVVSAKKDTYFCVSSLVLSTERSNGTCSLVHPKGTRQELHEKRLIPGNNCQKCKAGFHPTNGHDFDSHRDNKGILLGICRQKVGLIRCRQCGDRGTCFRIGRNIIVTCNHVIDKCKDHDVIAVFFHQGPEQQSKFSYGLVEKQIDEEKDFAILELRDDDGIGRFPPAFTTEFKESSTTGGGQEYPVCVVCFQKDPATGESILEVNCDTVRLKDNIFGDHLYNSNLKMMERFPNIKGAAPYGQGHLHKQNGGIPLLCDVTHGGSGGVGIRIDHQSGRFVVEFMYRRGYPGFYYNTNDKTALSTQEKEELSSCWRLEMGLDISKIIEHSKPEYWECDEHVSTSF